jgi:hypothetical protein
MRNSVPILKPQQPTTDRGEASSTSCALEVQGRHHALEVEELARQYSRAGTQYTTVPLAKDGLPAPDLRPGGGGCWVVITELPTGVRSWKSEAVTV